MKAIAGSPTILLNAGEYEIHGAFITGIPTFHDGEKGAEHGRNLAFVIEMEDIKVCHLGDLGHTPSAEQVEDMVGCDVLLIPVGGKHDDRRRQGGRDRQPARGQARRADALQDGRPRRRRSSTAERFLKEMQVTSVEPQPKLQINQNSIPSETQVDRAGLQGQDA